MTTQSLEIKRSSASMWGSKTGIRNVPTVAKYIDSSTCIGCKACEVACQEWNDLERTPTVQDGQYQTAPDLTPQLWNLIRFNEREVDGTLTWLMHKDQCRHCAEPGCLAACPAPGAIVQHANGIVDVDPEKCIGCKYCASGCPFDVPQFHAKTGKMTKCTLCVDRVEVGLEPACVKACPTGCLSFGEKTDMLALAKTRVSQLKSNGFEKAMVYDPHGVGGASVITVLKYDKPEWYGLPSDPGVPLLVRAWKNVLRPIGVIAAAFAVIGSFSHYTKYGPKEPASSEVKEMDQ